MSVISISKFRRKIRLYSKQRLKYKYNSLPKVSFSIDPVEHDRLTDKIIETLVNYAEKRDVFISKNGIN